MNIAMVIHVCTYILLFGKPTFQRIQSVNIIEEIEAELMSMRSDMVCLISREKGNLCKKKKSWLSSADRFPATLSFSQEDFSRTCKTNLSNHTGLFLSLCEYPRFCHCLVINRTLQYCTPFLACLRCKLTSMWCSRFTFPQ